MTRLNPKSPDSLFKWLITAFTREFFAHYFPALHLGAYSFIDKEFISKYEALKESLKGDLFLLMEVEIEGHFQEIAIQIEHQSERDDLAERLFEYLCYVWLLKKKPVWSIVIYTDEAIWRKPVTSQYYYGHDPSEAILYFNFDVIKVKDEKSSDLIQKHSLLCKLLALKANDEGTDPEQLVSEIYRATAQLKEQLTADQLLLITQWVDFYKKVPEPILAKIKQEVKMEPVETTISEYIYNQGKAEGRAEGHAEGRAEGRAEGVIEKQLAVLEGQLAVLEGLYRQGILSEAQLTVMAVPLRRKLINRKD